MHFIYYMLLFWRLAGARLHLFLTIVGIAKGECDNNWLYYGCKSKLQLQFYSLYFFLTDFRVDRTTNRHLVPVLFLTLESKVNQLKVDNPVYKLDKDTTPTINLHFGFHGELLLALVHSMKIISIILQRAEWIYLINIITVEYLFGKKCPNNKDKARINSIIDKVHSLLEENPGYSLSCTGHSLVSFLLASLHHFPTSNRWLNYLPTYFTRHWTGCCTLHLIRFLCGSSREDWKTIEGTRTRC